jgi:uncharacterized protein RhaS with RHS repeats
VSSGPSDLLGEVLSEDPLGFEAGDPNLYAYVGNSPVLFIDPLGLYVTVTLYQGQGVNPFGHVGIAINSSATVGFYGDDSLATAIGDPVSGHVASDLGHEVVETIRLDTTPEQERIINEFIVQRWANPGTYTLGGRNCAAFVADALKAAGLQTNGSVFPAGLMRDIKQRYGKSPILRP